MALTTGQLEEVLNYTAFQRYDTSQKEALRERLMHSELEYPQIAVLFSDDPSGGIIHDLVKESQDSDADAIQLGKIIENINESINSDYYGYAPTPIIQNLIGRLGSYNETIANDVKELVRQHVAIYNARVIEPTIDSPLAQQNEVAPGTSATTNIGATGLTRYEPQQAQELATGLRTLRLEMLNYRLINPDDLDARLEHAQHPLVPNSVALQDYNYILGREPDNIAALLGRARIKEEDEESHGYDVEAALADYKHVLEIEPQNQIALDGVERLAPSAARPE